MGRQKPPALNLVRSEKEELVLLLGCCVELCLLSNLTAAIS
jgi:hypothetical protein